MSMPMYGVLVDQQSDAVASTALPGNPNGGARPPPMSMAAPPAREFNTRDDLLTFQKAWAEEQGFAVVIGRSRPNRLWIKCDRGGEYSDKHLHDPENRKRKRKTTRLTGCPFNIKATMKKDKIWRCHTEVGEHNHPPSEDLSIHPSLRRMTDEQNRKVNEMTEAGNTPVETLDELQRLWPGIKVLRRDIYNARKKFKTEKELTDMVNGNTNQPPAWEDPNGKMPGPTKTGRWAWIEDGDEVKRKKRKKSSAGGQAQLQTPIHTSNQTFTPVFSQHSQPQQQQQQQQQPPPQHAHHPSQHQQPAQNNALAPELREQLTHSPQLPTPAHGAPPPRRGPIQPHRQYAPTQPPVQSSIPPPSLHSTPDFPGPMNPAAAGTPGSSSRFQGYLPHTHSPSGLGHGVSTPQQQHPHGAAAHQQQQARQQQQRNSYGRQPSDPTMPPQSGMRGSHRSSSMAQVQQPDQSAGLPLAPMQSPAMQNGIGITNMTPQTSQNSFPAGTGVNAQSTTAANSGGASGSGGGSASERGKGGSGQGQVLMSRIERMEKEQRDQKDLLGQILGAIRGMNGVQR